MRGVEWMEMLKLIPVDQHNNMVLVLKSGGEIMMESVFRFEPHFAVIRGRVGGTTDEGRAFFVPYDEMNYFRLERTVKADELEELFRGSVEASGPLPVPVPVAIPGKPAIVAPAIDPATAAREKLLERIRAARASSSHAG